ncbi:MAG: ornithine carbamoyltransferase [Bauldia sp.]|nr:ornithine carbamoyltransferase [Bauldia sp.]
MPRHFLELSDFDSTTLSGLIAEARRLKALRGKVGPERSLLAGKVLAMVFETQSTRTRISFDLAMRELGGETLVLSGTEMQLGREETIADTARVLSRYVDGIMIRILSPAHLSELADNASVPVVNGLTRHSHPCQVMADLMTLEERAGPLRGLTVAWTGDASNVLVSWIEAAPLFGISLRIATPEAYAPKHDVVDWARMHGADIMLLDDPVAAVDGADCVITDTWVSMGTEHERDKRLKTLAPYQVTTDLMGRAKPSAIFMHCLPAHRGEEVVSEVIDGPQSAVWDEAENRLHVQKAILAWCFAEARS